MIENTQEDRVGWSNPGKPASFGEQVKVQTISCASRGMSLREFLHFDFIPLIHNLYNFDPWLKCLYICFWKEITQVRVRSGVLGDGRVGKELPEGNQQDEEKESEKQE